MTHNLTYYLLWFILLLAGCASSQSPSPLEKVAAERSRPSPQFLQTLSNVDKLKLERPTLPPDYITGVAGVVGIYNRMLATPRFLIASVQAEAQSAFNKLRLSFPTARGSVTDASLELLNASSKNVLRTDSYVTNLERNRAGYNTIIPAAADADKAVAEMRLLIDRINDNLLSQ